MRLRTAVLAVALLALVAGCTSEPQPTRHRSPSPHKSPAAPAPPVTFGKPVWQRHIGYGAPDSQPYALSSVTKVELLGDLLVYSGEDRGGSYNRIVVADAATGKPRWSIDHHTPLRPGGGFIDVASPPSIVAGRTPLVIVEYGIDNDSLDGGIVALSAATGRVRWRLPHGHMPVLDFVDEHELIVDNTTFGDDTVDSETTVAYRMPDRRRLWSAPDIDHAQRVGDTVLAFRPQAMGYDLDADRVGTIVGLDATTGRQRWQLPGRHTNPAVAAATSSVAVLHDDDGTQTVDTTTGKRLDSTDTRLACETDAQRFLCVEDNDDQEDPALSRIDTDGSIHQLAQQPPVDEIDGFHDGTVYTSSSLAYDTAGHPFRGKLPGRLAAIDDDWAIFYTGALDSDVVRLIGCRVHR